MWLNGAKIGMVITAVLRRPTRKALPMALTACIVGAAGSSTPGSVVCRFGSTSRLPTAATTSACASFFSSHFIFSSEAGHEGMAEESPKIKKGFPMTYRMDGAKLIENEA